MRLALMLAAVLAALVMTSACALPSIELPRPVVNDSTAVPTAVVQTQATLRLPRRRRRWPHPCRCPHGRRSRRSRRN